MMRRVSRLPLLLLLLLPACGPDPADDVCQVRAVCTMRGRVPGDLGIAGYTFCTDAQIDITRAWFQTTDGQRFDCASPSDCDSAVASATAWCLGAAPDLGVPDLGGPRFDLSQPRDLRGTDSGGPDLGGPDSGGPD